MPTKTFATSYHIRTDTGFIVLNGDQITKMEAVKKGDNWDVIFYLPDGTSHTVPANAWTKQYITGIIEAAQVYP